jgi:hypothetical protein
MVAFLEMSNNNKLSLQAIKKLNHNKGTTHTLGMTIYIVLHSEDFSNVYLTRLSL